ncbi:MAG TPA: carboxypeptidase-like regulatory domain-containing protein, partial [Mariniflexile sp.]|nr:carboxypeptidase-like regulatory domain-containing protein [Mariniflexile sp.]
MKTKFQVSIALLFATLFVGYGQTATIKGVILDETNTPILNVNIKAGNKGTVTNANGFYLLEIPANTDVSVEFTHLSHKKVVAKFNLKNGEDYEFNPVMSTSVEQIAAVMVTNKRQKEVAGIVSLKPETIRKIPGANAGVENLLLTLPGVSNNNELSTQYAVRGGNYDENLVYVNDIEVYRPFLVRSGQQEGLSFVNTDLVQNVDFSAGGFQAKYGDKLSSVLDITYKTPYQFEVNADISLLGGSVSVESISKDSKFSGIVGVRYRDNSLLVKAKETETNYKPAFGDAQGYFTYMFSSKFHLSFLGNASLNKYNYQPQTRQTNFGT